MRRLAGFALLFASVLVFQACASHIHNPADKTLADQAQKQLQAVIKAQQERLAAMTANLEKIYAQESQAHREFGEKAAQATSQLILGMTWDDLRRAFADPPEPTPAPEKASADVPSARTARARGFPSDRLSVSNNGH